MGPFEDNDIEAIIIRGVHLNEMVQSSQGWKAVESIIGRMRHEAFSAWSELPLESKTEDVLALRATDKVLRDLIENIKTAITAGQDAAERKDTLGRVSGQERLFMAANGTDDAELKRLSEPLPSISEAITRMGRRG